MQRLLNAGALAALFALAACGQNVNHNSTAGEPKGPQTAGNAPTPAAAAADNNGAAPATPESGAAATSGGAAAQNSEPSAKLARSEPMADVKPSTSTPLPPPNEGEARNTPLPANVPAAARDRHIRRTAEAFAQISQQAFAAQPRDLARRIESAAGRAHALEPELGGAVVGRLTRHLRELRRAENKGLRADIAVAAADVYRTLVTSQNGEPRVPVSAEVLNYAGLRYQADLKAEPTRWNDAVRAADIARAQWADLRGTLHERTLSHGMARAVQEMSHAASRENGREAMRASAAEQHAMTRLDAYFKQQNNRG